MTETELLYESRTEHEMRRQFSEGAGVVQAVFGGVKEKVEGNGEDGFIVAVVNGMKAKVNRTMRNKVRRWRANRV